MLFVLQGACTALGRKLRIMSTRHILLASAVGLSLRTSRLDSNLLDPLRANLSALSATSCACSSMLQQLLPLIQTSLHVFWLSGVLEKLPFFCSLWLLPRGCTRCNNGPSQLRFLALSALAISSARSHSPQFQSSDPFPLERIWACLARAQHVELLDQAFCPDSFAPTRFPMELQVRPLAAESCFCPRRSWFLQPQFPPHLEAASSAWLRRILPESFSRSSARASLRACRPEMSAIQWCRAVKWSAARSETRSPSMRARISETFASRALPVATTGPDAKYTALCGRIQRCARSIVSERAQAAPSSLAWRKPSWTPAATWLAARTPSRCPPGAPRHPGDKVLPLQLIGLEQSRPDG